MLAVRIDARVVVHSIFLLRVDVHFSSEDSLPSGLFFFLSWNSQSGVEQFCILSESFLSDFDRCVSC